MTFLSAGMLYIYNCVKLSPRVAEFFSFANTTVEQVKLISSSKIIVDIIRAKFNVMLLHYSTLKGHYNKI